MRVPFTITILLSVLFVNRIFCQSPATDLKFSLKGEIIGRDTGSIILYYFRDDNMAVTDTVKLDNGRFKFSGTVNRACEALLWTDIKNRNFDDPSVIRFILEPTNVHISYKLSDPLNPLIKGSKAQTEKDNWDKVKMPLLINTRHYYDTLRLLAKSLKASPTPTTKLKLDRLVQQVDSVNDKIKIMDVKYIALHPNSYLSGYLLSKHTRKLSVDSIERYFNILAYNVKASSVGHIVLLYVYPLTNDNDFRKANPLIDAAFDERLANVHSVYDLSSQDTARNIFSFGVFKGKYLVLDFWASWCQPCIANIPAFNQLTQYYKAYPIQFVSISVDYDLTLWKRAIIKDGFSGMQLSDLAGFKGLSAIYCKTLWVPHYVVVDPYGRVINYDAPQASEPELKQMLDKLVSREVPTPEKSSNN